jgi:hypothetical protein
MKQSKNFSWVLWAALTFLSAQCVPAQPLDQRIVEQFAELVFAKGNTTPLMNNIYYGPNLMKKFGLYRAESAEDSTLRVQGLIVSIGDGAWLTCQDRDFATFRQLAMRATPNMTIKLASEQERAAFQKFVPYKLDDSTVYSIDTGYYRFIIDVSRKTNRVFVIELFDP